MVMIFAAVVELADATDSKSVGVKSVSVRPRSAALKKALALTVFNKTV